MEILVERSNVPGIPGNPEDSNRIAVGLLEDNLRREKSGVRLERERSRFSAESRI